MKLAYAVASLMIFTGGGASAQTEAPAAQSAPGQTAEAKPAPQVEKKICHTEDVTGSILQKRKVCLTQTEWAKRAADTQQDVDNLRSQTRPGLGR